MAKDIQRLSSRKADQGDIELFGEIDRRVEALPVFR